MNRRYRCLLVTVAAVAALALYAVPASATGNGAPSGNHYNLNVIGVPKGKTADMTGTSGHSLFTNLGTDQAPAGCKILLSMGDFKVLDRNCTDGTASFRLPASDTNGDGKSDYSVFARALGQPGGSASAYSCFFDQQTSTTYCATGNVMTLNSSDPRKFSNVTKYLLYVYYTDGSGTAQRTSLFADPLDSYWWEWTNKGLKLAQLRFYPGVCTQVPVATNPGGSQDIVDC